MLYKNIFVYKKMPILRVCLYHIAKIELTCKIIKKKGEK